MSSNARGHLIAPGIAPGIALAPGPLPARAHDPVFCALCAQIHQEPVYDHIERHANLVWLATAARHLHAMQSPADAGQPVQVDGYHLRMVNRLMAQTFRLLMAAAPPATRGLLSTVLLVWEAAVGL